MEEEITDAMTSLSSDIARHKKREYAPRLDIACSALTRRVSCSPPRVLFSSSEALLAFRVLVATTTWKIFSQTSINIITKKVTGLCMSTNRILVNIPDIRSNQ